MKTYINWILFTSFQDVELIEMIWAMTRDWDNSWNQWKGCRFLDIQTEEMETHSLNISRKLNKLSRDLKVKKYEPRFFFFF